MPRRLTTQDFAILSFAGLSPLYIVICNGQRALLRQIARLFRRTNLFRPEIRQALLDIIEATQDVEENWTHLIELTPRVLRLFFLRQRRRLRQVREHLLTMFNRITIRPIEISSDEERKDD